MSKPTKVAIAKCLSYDEGLGQAMHTVLDRIGGIRSFVRPGQSVLVKPNLLSDREPVQAVTTHPEVIRVLARMLKAAGARPFVADSPANVAKVERVWERSGMRAVCREEDVPLVSLEKAGSIPFTVDGMVFAVAKSVIEADVIITVPKVKTHVLTIMTGAVKNMYGVIPGFAKTTLHRNYPTPRRFGALLAALYSKVVPQLAIADGIVGMEGDGPAAGQPVRLGFLAASADSVALDTTLCRLLKVDPRAVPYFAELRRRQLGETDWEHIEVVGDAIDSIAPKRFRVPGTLRSRLIPGWLVAMLRPLVWIRPAFGDACVPCGLCEKACPMQALRVEKGAKPKLAPKRCIGCCCCHEICPHGAIVMASSPLLNLFRGERSQ